MSKAILEQFWEVDRVGGEGRVGRVCTPIPSIPHVLLLSPSRFPKPIYHCLTHIYQNYSIIASNTYPKTGLPLLYHCLTQVTQNCSTIVLHTYTKTALPLYYKCNPKLLYPCLTNVSHLQACRPRPAAISSATGVAVARHGTRPGPSRGWLAPEHSGCDAHSAGQHCCCAFAARERSALLAALCGQRLSHACPACPC